MYRVLTGDFEKMFLIGLPATTIDGFEMQIHFLRLSYIADIPETEKLIRLKHSSQTVMPCHMCFENENVFILCTKATKNFASL